MKTLLLLLAFLPGSLLRAQIGGKGSDGIFAPGRNTTLDDGPSGGVFHFESITIPANVTVFLRGARPIILLSQGDVVVAGKLTASAYTTGTISRLRSPDPVGTRAGHRPARPETRFRARGRGAARAGPGRSRAASGIPGMR